MIFILLFQPAVTILQTERTGALASTCNYYMESIQFESWLEYKLN
jgi:hypothetical protein